MPKYKLDDAEKTTINNLYKICIISFGICSFKSELSKNDRSITYQPKLTVTLLGDMCHR